MGKRKSLITYVTIIKGISTLVILAVFITWLLNPEERQLLSWLQGMGFISVTQLLLTFFQEGKKPESITDGVYTYAHKVFPTNRHVSEPLATYVISMQVVSGIIEDLDVSLVIPNADKEEQIQQHLRPINVDKFTYPYEVGDQLLVLKEGWKKTQ